MKFLFLMDPIQSIIYHKDTSFAFMKGAAKHGHDVYFLAQGGISLSPEGVLFSVQKISVEEPLRVGPLLTLHQDEVSAVFMRKDPPFDSAYLMDTWLLDRVKSTIFVFNDPAGIRSVNEKVWATQFKTLIPPTLVTRSQAQLLSFLDRYKKLIVKPTDGFGGASIFSVCQGDTNTKVIFETITKNGSEEIIAQPFIEEAKNGDKRLLLLDGDILGAVLRVHGDDDHRNNFFAGGKALACDITDRDREVVAILKPHLQALGLHFVGIDMIGDYLIEVNVTSPTCLQEMNRLYDVHLEDIVVQYVEKKVSEL
jgi:glutathione synthase